MKISKEIWNGNLSPITRFGQSNREMIKLESEIEKEFELLLSNLNERDKQILYRLKDYSDQYEICLCEQSFHDGFCLGMKIAAEAFMGSEEILE